MERPEDVFKCMDMNNSNNIVGDILKKVSSKIHQKLASGQLRQDQLLSEAMNMMSSMNGLGGSGGGSADFLQQMFANMGGGSGRQTSSSTGGQSSTSAATRSLMNSSHGRAAIARNRLRTKLQKKQNSV